MHGVKSMPLGNKISASTKKSAICKTIFCETFARSADFFRALQRLCAHVQALAASSLIAWRFATIRRAGKSMIRNASERLRISPQNAANRSTNRVLPRC